MYWVVIVLACVTPDIRACEVSTTQHLFVNEEACHGYIAAITVHEASNGRHVQGFCTDVDPPTAEAEDESPEVPSTDL